MKVTQVAPGAMSDVKDMAEWRRRVLSRDGDACINCGRTEKLAVCFVIPVEAGGKLRISNGVTVCRTCRLAADSVRALPQRIDNKTPINFLISRGLHKAVHEFVHGEEAGDRRPRFGSVSALLRAMISSYIMHPGMYEDLQSWQDDGSDVKVNGWVDGAQYEIFKTMCKEIGTSYTDALKSLLLVAVEGTLPMLPKGLRH